MKKVLLSAAIFAVSAVATAQEFNTKNSIHLRIGQSTPLGNFASISDQNEGPGYAMNGINYGINYERLLDENFSFTVGLSSSGHLMDDEILSENLTDLFQSNFQDDAYSAEMEDAAYGMAFFNIGAKYSFGGDKVKMYINPVVGMASFINPEQDVTVKYEGAPETTTINTAETSDLSFAFGANTGFTYRISQLISLNLNFEYVRSSFRLELENTTNNWQNEISTSELTTVQNYQVLNTSFGVGFNF
jgi:hypothetical protein